MAIEGRDPLVGDYVFICEIMKSFKNGKCVKWIKRIPGVFMSRDEDGRCFVKIKNPTMNHMGGWYTIETVAYESLITREPFGEEIY